MDILFQSLPLELVPRVIAFLDHLLLKQCVRLSDSDLPARVKENWRIVTSTLCDRSIIRWGVGKEVLWYTPALRVSAARYNLEPLRSEMGVRR